MAPMPSLAPALSPNAAQQTGAVCDELWIASYCMRNSLLPFRTNFRGCLAEKDLVFETTNIWCLSALP